MSGHLTLLERVGSSPYDYYDGTDSGICDELRTFIGLSLVPHIGDALIRSSIATPSQLPLSFFRSNPFRPMMVVPSSRSKG
jgi:hypothetical protein